MICWNLDKLIAQYSEQLVCFVLMSEREKMFFFVKMLTSDFTVSSCKWDHGIGMGSSSAYGIFPIYPIENLTRFTPFNTPWLISNFKIFNNSSIN